MTICDNLDEFLGYTAEKRATITELYLNNNQIGDLGATALAGALEDNITLTELHLASNQIGDVGATALAGALQGNIPLTKLYLSGNQIGDAGATALAGSLQDNTTLRYLALVNNQIGDVGTTALAGALEDNITLTGLYLVNNQIGNVGATALAGALEDNITLTELHLIYNQIGNVGTTALARALKGNTTLRYLTIGIDVEAMKSIQESKSRNKQIYQVTSDALIKISKGGDVVDIDIRKIEGIAHIESIPPTINLVDVYLRNPGALNAQYPGLTSNKKFQQLVIEHETEVNLSKALPLTKVKKMSALHGDDFLKIIGQFLSKKDAENLKLAYADSSPTSSTTPATKDEAPEENLKDLGGGGGRAIVEANAKAAEEADAGAAAELLAATFDTPQEPEETATTVTGDSAAADADAYL